MSGGLLASALAGWTEDAKTFAAAVRFGGPGVLWLSVAPLAVALVGWWVRRRDQARLARLGRPGAVAGLLTAAAGHRRFARFFLLLAWTALVLALARPRWGVSDERGVAIGRDVVIVLDFSRSMWAEDMAGRTNPARWQATVAAARELVDRLQARGGHRVGVVLFAARPKLLVPLTTDTDHVVFRLGELDATTPPAEIRPTEDAPSGTRIGAAIVTAVAAHDPQFPGVQDVVLLTDGDDPAGDAEWRTGVTAARVARVPVHVVGLGDPNRESTIPFRGEFLEATDKNGVRVPVQTRLHEEVAKAIADETHGAYLPARVEPPQLDEFYRAKIESNATRELSDERLPQPRERYTWFLAAGGLLLLLAWWRGR